MSMRLRVDVSKALRVRENAPERAFRLNQVSATPERFSESEPAQEFGVPVPHGCGHGPALGIRLLGRIERVELAAHPRAAQPRPDGVSRRELRAADLQQ